MSIPVSYELHIISCPESCDLFVESLKHQNGQSKPEFQGRRRICEAPVIVACSLQRKGNGKVDEIGREERQVRSKHRQTD